MTHQIQRHHIWGQMSFWESVFNEHVNSQIRQLYLHFSEQEQQQQQCNQRRSPPLPHPGDNQTDKSFVRSPNENCLSNGLSSSAEPPRGERVITVGIRRKSQVGVAFLRCLFEKIIICLMLYPHGTSFVFPCQPVFFLPDTSCEIFATDASWVSGW